MMCCPLRTIQRGVGIVPVLLKVGRRFLLGHSGVHGLVCHLVLVTRNANAVDQPQGKGQPNQLRTRMWTGMPHNNDQQ